MNNQTPARWKQAEPMSAHTTFRIGGPADYFSEPETIEELREDLQTAEEMGIPYYVIGNGSNLLVSDRGYRGLIIRLYRRWNKVETEEASDGGIYLYAQAGALLSYLAHIAQDLGMTGMEPLSGIPGTLGGAVIMNAGAYGGEIKDVLVSADVLLPGGTVQTLRLEDLELGYRTSRIAKEGGIVLGAVLYLKPGDPAKIAELMDDLRNRRITKQPLELPSAGSTFKRPEGYFAGKLISDAGLKGYRVGDAMVSEKHAGFVVNAGHASADDVHRLIRDVQEQVRAQFGVSLEPEVKFLGEE